jgi:polar amino acid transport system substrate-binding protein
MRCHWSSGVSSLLIWVFIAAAARVAIAQDKPQELRWAGDPEGGAPFVEASPTNPDALVGFDVEIANLIARGLGRSPRFVTIQFASIDQSVTRGDADIGLSGIEDTPARRAAMAATVPYYEFREVLSVRDADRRQFRTLKDLTGRRVATLGGTIAYEILVRAERQYGITPVSYDDDVHPYSDLVLGRVDAVLLDNVLAERRKATVSGYAVQPDSVAISHYVGVLAAANTMLRDRADEILHRDERRHARAHPDEVGCLER